MPSQPKWRARCGCVLYDLELILPQSRSYRSCTGWSSCISHGIVSVLIIPQQRSSFRCIQRDATLLLTAERCRSSPVQTGTLPKADCAALSLSQVAHAYCSRYRSQRVSITCLALASSLITSSKYPGASAGDATDSTWLCRWQNDSSSSMSSGEENFS